MNSIKLILKKIIDLVNEVEVYEYYKENLIETLKKINDDYLKGKINFSEYEAKLKKVLGKKSKKELIRYYNSYIYYLLKKIQFYNSQVFYIAYHDDLYKNLKLPKHVESQLKYLKALKGKLKKETVASKKGEIEKSEQRIIEPLHDKNKISLFDKVKAVFKIKQRKSILNLSSKTRELEEKLEKEKGLLNESVFDSDFEKKLEAELDKKSLKKEKGLFKNVKSVISKEPEISKRSFNSIYDRLKDDFEKLVPKPMQLDANLEVPSPAMHNVLNFFSSLIESLKVKIGLKKDESDLYSEFKDLSLSSEKEVSSILDSVKAKEGRTVKKNIKVDEEKFGISDKTEIGESMLSLVTKEEKGKKEDEEFSETTLMKEAKHMKKLIESQKKESEKEANFWKKYNFINRILNIHVKKLSLRMIESFPGLFKNLYEYLRFADIKMLSNTYVNLMIFLTIATFIIMFPLSLIFNIFKGIFVLNAFINALFFSLLMSVIVFFSVYHYPAVRIKAIRRSINSNLPFAINHMTAIAASGVPPTTMFKLIALSEEYGEVSKEIRKVSDFITLFGYDVLTAVKQVASTTPARSLKEFLDGFVSTVETGGDLVSYLKQKSDESMMAYNLERQKYNETISTYSDVYTGIMVAAPLFFMSTLSIINLLGGKVGRINVNSLLGYAIYLVMPLINIGFLIFVHFNQPEV